MTAPRNFILGTAGHVDHGKSALVKALTGTDPDRLPEEKERGITIDLGFANLRMTAPVAAVSDRRKSETEDRRYRRRISTSVSWMCRATKTSCAMPRAASRS